MDELCYACLSTDRRLVQVNIHKDKSMYAYFFESLMTDKVNICWECKALFMKVYKFKTQVLQAQETIKSLTYQKLYTLPKPQQVSSLSSLSIATVIICECCIKSEDICDLETPNHTHEDDTNTYLNEIHTNNIESQDYFNSSQIIDNICSLNTNDCVDSNKLNIGLPSNVTTDNIEIKTEGAANNKTKKYVELDEYKFADREIESDDGAANEKTITLRSLLKTSQHFELDESIYLKSQIEDGVAYEKKGVDDVAEQSYSKDNFIVTKLSDEEMLKNREMDREAVRYKRCSFKCELCIMGYYDEEKYKRHNKEKHSESAGRFICPICKTRFTRDHHRRDHEETHYRGYKCKCCDFSHHKLNTMVIHHTKEHERETKYVCAICGKVFDTKRTLRYHRDKVHRELPKCQLCQKTFSTNASLKIHITSHTTDRLHPCPTCNRTYKNAQALRAHSRSHRAPEEGAYCAECDRQFRDAYVYSRHLTEHRAHVKTSELKFVCAHCDARFAYKTYLRRHIYSIHLKIYPFSCDICNKSFSARYRLKEHVLVKHEGVAIRRDKICSYCGRGFAKRSTLIVHLRTHTGERPFSCEVCDASFTQKHALKTHARALHPNADTGF